MQAPQHIVPPPLQDFAPASSPEQALDSEHAHVRAPRSRWSLSKWTWMGCVPLFCTLLTGCGGLTASPSVSPLMFLLPGLGQNGGARESAPANNGSAAAPMLNSIAA